MQDYLKNVYRIHIVDSHSLPINLILEEVYHLYDTTESGYDGWLSNDKSKKSLIISHRNWANIALISNPKNRSIPELIGYGAELVEKSLVYDTITDATIQMAFIATKFDVGADKIYEVTNNILSASAYKQLLKIFYNDFPEKII